MRVICSGRDLMVVSPDRLRDSVGEERSRSELGPRASLPSTASKCAFGRGWKERWTSPSPQPFTLPPLAESLW